MQKLQMLN